jgi:hypothetical protein
LGYFHHLSLIQDFTMVEENFENRFPEKLQLGYFHHLSLIQVFTMVEENF